MAHGTTNIAAGGSTRCVLLAPAGAAVSDRLRSLPQARSWRLTPQEYACAAMAELCLREKAQSSRAAWGLQRAERLALVLAAPRFSIDEDLEDELSDLVAAVRRYLPRIPIWLFDGESLSVIARGETTPLREAPPSAPAQAVEPTPSAVAAAPRMQTGLRLTEPDEETPTSAASEADDEPATAADDEPAQITPEEIQMLLARDGDEGTGP